LGRGAVFDLKG